ncbi:endonuclease III [Candidatus Legionella polyplacis]|uniref:Endonuclease III n=1 Tax=Candidatus Legionella polyplacis TaxID=2005262 RepID=A0ABZ2GYJ7_9GAMM
MNKSKCDEVLIRLSNSIVPISILNLNKELSNFELLIAIILSARTTDLKVNEVIHKLFAIANTPKKIFFLGEEKLQEIVKPLGFYRNKSKNVIKTAYLIMKDYCNEVPFVFENLKNLPGVGRKTANLFLNIAFGYSTIAIDTHVFRVSNRIGIGKGKNTYEVEKDLLRNVHKRFIRNLHNYLLLHGRYICLSNKPLCHVCIISDLCEFNLNLFKSK